ncbi:MAG: SpoIID/LytB domain-containing protein [Candidatus Omnitrophica bacterium]|nr:SpoIID/LytB domain-containing protein [Candidatus Omnitrophota bacterium]
MSVNTDSYKTIFPGSNCRIKFFRVFILFLFLPSLFCLAATHQQALFLYKKGEYEEAEKLYEELVNEEPQKDIVYLELACLYKELLDYDRSIELFRESIPRIKDKELRKEVLILLGQLYYLKGRDKQAFKIFKKNEVKDIRDWRVHLYLGLIYEDSGSFLLAKKHYSEVLKLKKISVASYRLAKIFYKQKNYKESAYYFKKTLEIAPSTRLAYYYLGRSHLKNEEYEPAYNSLFKAISFYPGNEQIKKIFLLAKSGLGKDYFLRKSSAIEKNRRAKKLSAYKKLRTDFPLLRVRIIKSGREFTFKCGGDFKISSGDNSFKGAKDTFYTFYYKKHRMCLYAYKTKKEIGRFNFPVKISIDNKPFYILEVTSGKGDFWQKRIDSLYRGNFEIVERDDSIDLINIVDLEEYLYGVIAAEIFPSSPFEALKTQAVAARTIAVKNLGRHSKEGFDFCNTTHCQVYRGLTVETLSIKKAVDATRGEVILYNGKPVEAFYHANCGGCLRGDAFAHRPYLFSNRLDCEQISSFNSTPWEEESWFKNPDSGLCKFSKRGNFRWQRVYDRDDFKTIFGFPIEELDKIIVRSKGDCAHIKEVQMNCKGNKRIIKGDLNIRKYFGNLKSSAFKLEIKYNRVNRKPAMLFIWGGGFGHGTGLCQEGVIALAGKGYSYKEIIAHYYKDVEVGRFPIK